MARRPIPALDNQRFMQRVEDRIDAAFNTVLEELGTVKGEIRKGNMNTELLTQRVTDLEIQVIETRSHMQITDRATETSRANVAERAQAAVIKAEAAPKKVWRTKLGLITTTSAAFVAVVALFNNVPKFVRGASEMAVSLYQYIVNHG